MRTFLKKDAWNVAFRGVPMAFRIDVLVAHQRPAVAFGIPDTQIAMLGHADNKCPLFSR